MKMSSNNIMNNSIKKVVSIIGVVFGVGGIGHGFFETLQGNKPTEGLMIHAIGEAQKMWVNGNEPALTIIPNYLVTGVAAMVVGMLIIIWSIGFMHRKYAASIYLILFVTLLLVGGGIGQIIFFTIGWLLATRIDKRLLLFRRIMPKAFRTVMKKVWRVTLFVSAGLIMCALEIAMFGIVPGMKDPNIITNTMLMSLGIGLLLLLISSLSAIAYDIEKQEEVIIHE